MLYKVMSVSGDTLTLWDRKSMVDPDMPGVKATEDWTVPGHTFMPGDFVQASLLLHHRSGLHCDSSQPCAQCGRHEPVTS